MAPLARAARSWPHCRLISFVNGSSFLQAVVAEETEPPLSVVAHVDVVMGEVFDVEVFDVATKKHPRPIVSVSIVWALFGLFVARPIFASSVVALVDRGQDRIVLAADGCFLNLSPAVSGEVCKIFSPTPDCAFGMVGLSLASETNFNLAELATAACRQSGNLRQKAAFFLKSTESRARLAAKFIHNAYPWMYREVIGKQLASVVFLGVDHGELSLNVCHFYKDGKVAPFCREGGNTDSFWINQKTFNIEAPHAILGGLRGIVDYIGAHPDWERDDFVGTARAFLQAEIDEDSDVVGAPISILVMNRVTGRPEQAVTHWLERGACDASTQNRGANQTNR